MEVTRDRSNGRIELKLIAKDEWGRNQVGTLVDNLTYQLCTQFYTFLGIRGEIIEID